MRMRCWRRCSRSSGSSGAQRPFQDAPRTLDLDLILYGDGIIDEPGLVVPHPRFRQRRFVLEPLAEIAADWLDPVSGRRVEELLRQTRRLGGRKHEKRVGRESDPFMPEAWSLEPGARP